MKRLLIIAIVLVAMATPVFAIDYITPEVGVWSFMRKGTHPAMGMSFSADIPTGLDIESVKAIIPDTASTVKGATDTTVTTTYQLVIHPEIYYSDFQFSESVGEIEAKAVSVMNYKTLGFWNTYIEVGGTLWNLSNIESDSTSGGNETLIGYYTGFGGSIIGLDWGFGAHFLPIKDEPDLWVVGLRLGRSF